MSVRNHRRPLTPYYPPLACETVQKHQLADPSTQPAKRVKTAVEPVLLTELPRIASATNTPEERTTTYEYAPPRPPRIQPSPPLPRPPGALRKPLIEVSPPCSPSTPPARISKETAEFRMAFELFQDAEYGSSQETRVVNAKDGCEAFERIATSKNRFSPEAEYLQALCQMRLALNMDDPFVQADKLSLATYFFQKIHTQHPHYWDAQYWEGYCQLRLGKMESIPKNKFTKFTRAKEKFEQVLQIETLFAKDAQRLFQECMQELNLLPKNATITFYGAKH